MITCDYLVVRQLDELPVYNIGGMSSNNLPSTIFTRGTVGTGATGHHPNPRINSSLNSSQMFPKAGTSGGAPWQGSSAATSGNIFANNSAPSNPGSSTPTQPTASVA